MSIRVDFERILEMITSISMTPAPQAILETLVGCLVNVLNASMSSSSWNNSVGRVAHLFLKSNGLILPCHSYCPWWSSAALVFSCSPDRSPDVSGKIDRPSFQLFWFQEASSPARCPPDHLQTLSWVLVSFPSPREEHSCLTKSLVHSPVIWAQAS